jgi:hypothetical protein
MGQQVIADQIRRKLREAKSEEEREEVRQELTEWWRSKGSSYHLYEPEEKRRIRGALGLSQNLEDTPFVELVPEGWFLDLLNVQAESEAPTAFYFLSAMAVFSQMVGRKVMIDRGNHLLGVDTSALLISPAGKGRRSTACDFVVYEIGEPAGLNVIADSFTYEAFGDALVRSTGEKLNERQAVGAHALAYAGEMSVLLGKGSYADSIIPKLTDMIGKTTKFSWATVKRGGKIEFVNPCVNALFTSAPDWLAEAIPSIVFGGGTLSRFLMCVRDGPERVVTWAKRLKEGDVRGLVTDLAILTDRKGRFREPTGRAFKWYHEWYQQHCKLTLTGEIADERMAPYHSRKHVHLLRLAANMEMAAGADELLFTEGRLIQALTVLDWLEVDIPKAYARMALSPYAAAMQAAVEKIQRAGGMLEHYKLQKAMYRHCQGKEQFVAIMESLIAMNVVRKIKFRGSRGYHYQAIRSLE